VKHASADAIQGTGERIDCEFRVRRRDGTYAHVRARSFIVREADGTPLRVIGSLSDISERHEIEQMSATLAHAARLASVGELAATITHEINQPMSAILSNVDAAEMLIEGDGARGRAARHPQRHPQRRSPCRRGNSPYPRPLAQATCADRIVRDR